MQSCQIKKPFGEVETRELMGGTEANSVFTHVWSLIYTLLASPQYLIADALPVYYILLQEEEEKTLSAFYIQQI